MQPYSSQKVNSAVSNAFTTGMNPIAEKTTAASTALYSAFMIEPLAPMRAKNVPSTEAMIATPPIASGKTTRFVDANWSAPRNITATAVTA